MKERYIIFLFNIISYIVFYILTAHLGLLNLYSVNINHSVFYKVYNTYSLIFVICSYFFSNKRNNFFYIFIFPTILCFITQISVYTDSAGNDLFLIMPVVIINYVLLGFWILPFLLWISKILTDFFIS